MQPDLSLFSIIMLLGAAHGLFLALTLINTREAKGTGRAFLAILTLALAIDLGHEFLYQSRYLLNVQMLGYVDPIINLLYGPSIYLYVRILTKGISFKLTKNHGLHLLPVTTAIIACALLPELSESQFIHLFYDENVANSSDEILVRTTISRIALASVFSLGCYLFLSIRLLILHTKIVRQQFSYMEKVTLNWLRILLLATSSIYSILILDGFFSGIIGEHDDVNNLLYLIIVAVIYAMGYMGLKQPVIFSNREPASTLGKITSPPELSLIDTEHNATEKLDRENRDTEKSELKDDIKYKTSSLDSTMSSALKENLLRQMKVEKPYLESQLTLPKLAKQLGISPNYLSQVINEQHQMNFFDFINEYRIGEAKLLLTHDQKKNTNILNVVYDSGFNSKSAFYNAFKKHVGMTPSEFRKLHSSSS